MSRDLFDIEVGLSISAENGERLAYVISETAAPDGVAGKQGDAPLSSLYLRSGTSEIYKKIANAGAPADWELLGSSAIDEIKWRSEKVRFATGDTMVAGAVNVLTLSDNDDMVYADISVGEFAIGDVDGTPTLFEITALPGTPNITVVAAAQPIADNNTFIVQQYLPDPSGQEDQAIIHFPLASGAGIKIGDISWEFATGINLSAGYTPGSGNVTSADSVESAIEKLDGNNDAQDTALGIAQGDTDMGTYTGDIITDNSSQTVINQELETAIEASGPTQFVGTVAQNTPTNVDTVLADDIQAVQWLVTARDTANPARVRSRIVHASHNGHGSADATKTDDTVYARLNLGAFNLKINTGVSGVGAAQIMYLELDTNEASGMSYTVERLHALPLAG